MTEFYDQYTGFEDAPRGILSDSTTPYKYRYATYMYTKTQAIAAYLEIEAALPSSVRCIEEGGFLVVWHE